MTREEAIKELEEDKALYMPKEWIESLDRDTPDGRLITALDMAIKALEQKELIPDNATNGDVIKKLFSDAVCNEEDTFVYIYRNKKRLELKGGYLTKVAKKWWNEPYKAESEAM